MSFVISIFFGKEIRVCDQYQIDNSSNSMMKFGSLSCNLNVIFLVEISFSGISIFSILSKSLILLCTWDALVALYLNLSINASCFSKYFC